MADLAVEQAADDTTSLRQQGVTPERCSSLTQGRDTLLPLELRHYIALGSIRLYKAGEGSCLPANLWTMQGTLSGDATFPSAAVSHLVEKGCLQTHLVDQPATCLRLYAMPEDVGRPNRTETLKTEYRRFIKQILGFIDRSLLTWNGEWNRHSSMETYLENGTDQESLFYIFNTLESPRPSLERAGGIYSHRSMEDILQGTVQGLRTELYPYQQRSAAMMIQRETNPIMSLDPRLSLYNGPTGQVFYLDKEEGEIRKEPYLYDEPRGGILAETMGYGKTLICLAVILATRGHFPRVPDDQTEPPAEPRPKTASLLEMAARQTCRWAIPWKAEFHALSTTGCHYERCIEELRKYVKQYNEPILAASN